MTLEGRLSELENVIKTARLEHTKSGLVLGRALTEAHSVLASEGKFKEFIARCDFSLRTAYNYMDAWREFSGVRGTIETTAMYALCAKSVPESAKEEAKSLAESGVVVTLDKAQKIIEAHRQALPVKPQDGTRVEKEVREHKELDLTEFLAEANRQSDLPAIDDDIEDMSPFEAADKLFSKGLDTVYRLVRTTEDINSIVPNEPLMERVHFNLQEIAVALKLWKRALR